MQKRGKQDWGEGEGVLLEASADTTGCSQAGVVFQSYPKLGQGRRLFFIPASATSGRAVALDPSNPLQLRAISNEG